MISNIFGALIYNPLYNALILLVDIIPGGDIGLAVIGLTIIVKLILFPLSKKATETNMKMKEIQPKMKEIQEKYKDNREAQALEMLKLYKEKKLNPLSSIALIFIQIPIILGLYWVFLKAGWPSIHTDILYSFISAPEAVNTVFVGMVDILERSVFLAILVGVTQFYQVRLAMPALEQKKTDNPSFKEDLAKSMQFQMRYILPIFVAIIAYTISSAISLYWITSNLFTIGQEIVIRRRNKEPEVEIIKNAS